MDKFEDRCLISGIGMSEVGRRLGRDPLDLVFEAAEAAAADAGLALNQLDGVCTTPGPAERGYSGAGALEITDLLRLRPAWLSGGSEHPGHTGAVVNAMLAVASGLCRHALCVVSTWESTYEHLRRSGQIAAHPGGRAAGERSWRAPFGAGSVAPMIAMAASVHMRTFGTTREQLGALAVNARANAALNPRAVYREPLSLEQYLEARTVCSPFGLYDCDVPCDGAVAVVVSTAEAAADLPRPVRVDAVGTAISERVSWDQGVLTHEPMLQGPADHLWTRTALRPADVDIAELYDGFTFNCLSWLERLGFCALGEGGQFVEGGSRIALDGELPLNTGGGQLSGGRLHGFGLLHEAVVQLRGDAGARQVQGRPQVAVVATGGGYPGGCLLLTA
jgi:acetyl-CoA acetyltransferase